MECLDVVMIMIIIRAVLDMIGAQNKNYTFPATCMYIYLSLARTILTQHIDGHVPLVWLPDTIVCRALVMTNRMPVGMHHFQHIVGDVRLAIWHYVVLW